MYGGKHFGTDLGTTVENQFNAANTGTLFGQSRSAAKSDKAKVRMNKLLIANLYSKNEGRRFKTIE